MTFWEKLLSNQVLICALCAWTIAQALKTLIDFWFTKTFSPERMVGSGGMPSSHSATVCALTTSTGMLYGVESFQFAVCFVLSTVVMYDAIGVRQETGKHSKLLNLLLEKNIFELDNEQLQQRLKEFVGHTPLQVLAGAVLGILVALVIPNFYS